MTTRLLTSCPECGTTLHKADVLIEYEHSAGGLAGFAGCPDCERVVKVAL